MTRSQSASVTPSGWSMKIRRTSPGLLDEQHVDPRRPGLEALLDFDLKGAVEHLSLLELT